MPSPTVSRSGARTDLRRIATLMLAAMLCSASLANACAATALASARTGGPMNAWAVAGSTLLPADVMASIESTPATPAPIPTSNEVASATKWARTRKGVVAYAVVDSTAAMYGYHVDERFVTASVVKAMLLVGYLRKHPKPSASALETLKNMIHVSDNNAAATIYHAVGDAGLRNVAKLAKMRNFSVEYSWGWAQLTPADQARFFLHMDSLIPTRDVGFARYQLSHITAAQSWGIPAVARPAGWTVFFKGGWRTTVRGQLVHQISRLERKGVTISIAVMTDGDPSMGYGISTIRGITQRLLGVVK